MLTFERKYSFETKILNNGEPSFVDGLRADVKEPDAEYLRPDFVFSARRTAYLKHPPCQPVSFICCHAELQMVPVFRRTVRTCCFHGYWNQRLFGLLYLLVILLLFDAFKHCACDKTRLM